MKHIKVIPIDAAIEPDMAAAVDSFISANCPASKADKAWAVYSEDGETIKILGFASCNLGSRMADVPVYHIEHGETRQSKWEAMKAHQLLFARVTGFIADRLGSGTQAFFHIAPEAQEHWKDFAETVQGKNAHRFVMEV
jgi:hypothetical protein